jgi:hypothetical protein
VSIQNKSFVIITGLIGSIIILQQRRNTIKDLDIDLNLRPTYIILSCFAKGVFFLKKKRDLLFSRSKTKEKEDY